MEAVGAFDELNVAIGAARPHLGATPKDEKLGELLLTIQKNLIALMGEVACAESDVQRHATSKFKRIDAADVQRIDAAVSDLESLGLKFDGWATPGANPRAAAFDTARATARRAERRLCSLPAHGRSVRPELRQFVNRVSDLLWLLARDAEQ